MLVLANPVKGAVATVVIVAPAEAGTGGGKGGGVRN